MERIFAGCFQKSSLSRFTPPSYTMPQFLFKKMGLIALAILGSWGSLLNNASASSFYCAQGSSFIQVGMTESQVISACGQPLSKTVSNQPATHKMQVTQLIYTSLVSATLGDGIKSAVFDQWSFPTGPSAGFTLQVNVIDNKVSSIQLNGGNTNAMSVCNGANIQVGDDVSNVYAQCGSPNTTNTTYINQPIPGNNKSEIWTYQADQYQPPFRLTFVNGSLESID
jgi:hypothetical protein